MVGSDEITADSEHTNFFKVPGVPHEILIIPDPPHLLKCARNALYNNKEFTLSDEDVKEFDLPTNKVKWEYVVNLVKFQEKNRQLKICPHLGIKDVSPSNQEKMNVKYATHVFSEATATAIDFCVEHYPEDWPVEAKTTSFFLRKAAQYFNQMMSRAHSMAFSFARLEEFEKTVEKLEWFSDFYCRTKLHNSQKDSLKPSQHGVRKATRNMIQLALFMLEQEGIVYLKPGLVSNDPIENLHSQIRSKNPNPTPLRFMRILRAICMCQCLDPTIHGSYNYDETEGALIDLSEIKAQKQKRLEDIVKENIEAVDDINEVEEDEFFASVIHPSLQQTDLKVEEDISELNALAYLNGYLLQKTICSKSKCEKCMGAFVTDEADEQLCNELIRLREYKIGVFKKPSTLANEMIRFAENIFRCEQEKLQSQKKTRIGDKLASKIFLHWKEYFPQAPMCHLKILAARFAKIRLYFYGKHLSRQLESTQQKKISGAANASKSTKIRQVHHTVTI